MENNFKKYRDKESGEIVGATPYTIEHSEPTGQYIQIAAMQIPKAHKIIESTRFNEQYEPIENDNGK